MLTIDTTTNEPAAAGRLDSRYASAILVLIGISLIVAASVNAFGLSYLSPRVILSGPTQTDTMVSFYPGVMIVAFYAFATAVVLESRMAHLTALAVIVFDAGLLAALPAILHNRNVDGSEIAMLMTALAGSFVVLSVYCVGCASRVRMTKGKTNVLSRILCISVCLLFSATLALRVAAESGLGEIVTGVVASGLMPASVLALVAAPLAMIVRHREICRAVSIQTATKPYIFGRLCETTALVAIVIVTLSLIVVPSTICVFANLSMSDQFFVLSACIAAGFLLGATVSNSIAELFSERESSRAGNTDNGVSRVISVFLVTTLSTSLLLTGRFLPVICVTVGLTCGVSCCLAIDALIRDTEEMPESRVVFGVCAAIVVMLAFMCSSTITDKVIAISAVSAIRDMSLWATIASLSILTLWRRARLKVLSMALSLIIDSRQPRRLIKKVDGDMLLLKIDSLASGGLQKIDSYSAILVGLSIPCQTLVVTDDGLLNLSFVKYLLSKLNVQISTTGSMQNDLNSLLSKGPGTTVLYTDAPDLTRSDLRFPVRIARIELNQGDRNSLIRPGRRTLTVSPVMTAANCAEHEHWNVSAENT